MGNRDHVQPLAIQMRRKESGRQLRAFNKGMVEAPVLLDRDQLDAGVGSAAGLQNHLEQ